MANQISFLGSLFISIYLMHAYTYWLSTFLSYCYYCLKDSISQNVSSLDSFCPWFSLGTVLPSARLWTIPRKKLVPNKGWGVCFLWALN